VTIIAELVEEDLTVDMVIHVAVNGKE